MASLAIDGLISGLQTTDLINSLMAIESAPQTLLKNKVSTTQTLVGALQSFNATVANLATTAKSASAPASVDLFTTTTSATSVTATATTGAVPGRIDFTVGQIAKSQVSVSAAMAAWPDSPATFTIVGSDGTQTELTAASTSLADVAKAINASSAGVKAVRVAAGTDGNGADLYRLQLTSAETGADGAFSIYRGTAADVTAGTATDLLAATGAATVTQASDASITLWAGTPAEQVVTSTSNTFTDVLPGVSLTVSAVESTPVSLTIAKDTAAVSNVAAGLVSSLNSVFSLVDSLTAVSTTTSSTGSSSAKGGIFTGNSLVRDMRDQLLRAASDPVNGRSPSEIGVTITRDGTITYDKDKFAAALAADPAATQSMLQTISSRVEKVSTGASDKYTGTITKAITGQQSALTSLSDQIADWDVRLATQRSGLERVYAALEVSLSNLQSQSSWLTSQISALESSTS